MMEINLMHVSILVISCVLLQFLFKWTVGNKITSKEDMMSQSRKDYHMIRRLQHMSTGLVILVILTYSPKFYCIMGLIIGTVGFFLVNAYRLIKPSFNEVYIKNFGFLLRPHEINNMPGAFYFLLGVFFSVALFDKMESNLSVLILSFGDPFASLCGIFFKTPKITHDKSIGGTLGCGIVCALLSLVFYYFNDDYIQVREQIMPWEFSFVTLIIAILAEIAPSSRKLHFEDNTSIPLYSGLLFTIYFKYIHILV